MMSIVCFQIEMITDLPPELLLAIFSFLPLKSLIAAQGVDQQWRRLVPLANHPRARKALLELYHTVVNSPAFEYTRQFILPNLVPFERDDYLAVLAIRCGTLPTLLPDEFRYWVLEWPALAVIEGTWPGMRNKRWGTRTPSLIRDNSNSLSVCPPVTKYLKLWTRIKEQDKNGSFPPNTFNPVPERASVISLEVSQDTTGRKTWLVLGNSDRDLKGTVHLSGDMIGAPVSQLASSWVEWQRLVLHLLEYRLRKLHLL